MPSGVLCVNISVLTWHGSWRVKGQVFRSVKQFCFVSLLLLSCITFRPTISNNFELFCCVLIFIFLLQNLLMDLLQEV